MFHGVCCRKGRDLSISKHLVVTPGCGFYCRKGEYLSIAEGWLLPLPVVFVVGRAST